MGPKNLCTKNGPTRFSLLQNVGFSHDGHFGVCVGGVGTRPRYQVVCLWRRLLASRHGSF